uniref:Uncharacterized protein n=1 Tax=Arion vulgaris TaxID=1028688 RepID=A0A0B7BRU2_9EUPU
MRCSYLKDTFRLFCLLVIDLCTFVEFSSTAVVLRSGSFWWQDKLYAIIFMSLYYKISTMLSILLALAKPTRKPWQNYKEAQSLVDTKTLLVGDDLDRHVD